MNSLPAIHRKLPLFIALSILGHILLFYPLSLFHTYNFAAPVMPVLTVDLGHIPAVPQPLAQHKAASSASHRLEKSPPAAPVTGAPPGDTAKPAAGHREDAVDIGLKAPRPAAPESAVSAGVPRPITEKNSAPAVAPPTPAPLRRKSLVQPPLVQPGSVMSTKREKLTYSITTFLGISVGKAELEAVNDKGDLRITMRATSNEVFSTVYPVDINVETKLIKGNNIIARIRQRDGGGVSDFGFTIALRDKLVVWSDLKANRFGQEQIPVDDVLDLITASYMLRTKPLQVGTPVTLQVYDYTFSTLPVEVVRRERIRLSGLGEVGALVVQPRFQQDGIFKKTSNMLVWLSDDEKHVPLKIETDIPVVGRVTATLIDSESEPATQEPTSR